MINGFMDGLIGILKGLLLGTAYEANGNDVKAAEEPSLHENGSFASIEGSDPAFDDSIQEIGKYSNLVPLDEDIAII